MNHPFPANLPLLRQVYGKRFSHVRFLIPFERSADPDVLTVYRGSYAHAGYLTDVRAALSALDCDYYLIVHDDVLLNPSLDEATFRSMFDLGPDDGFIPHVSPLTAEAGRWVWAFGCLPRLLYPKSLLFGAGVEIANLARYLPSAVTVRARMMAQGIVPTDRVSFDANLMEDVTRIPANVLLHGLSAQFADTPEQRKIEEASLDVSRRLVQTLAAASSQARETDAAASGAGSAELPFPLVQSGYFTDLYVLPRSGFDSFCHYVGVASAAGLFAEIFAPSLLYACCDRVVTAAEANLDFGGFDEVRSIESFRDPRTAALHPFKLSAFGDPGRRAALMELLQDVANGRESPMSTWQRAQLCPSLGHVPIDGWQAQEHWGRWSGKESATLRVRLTSTGPVRLLLRAPTGPASPHLTGRIRYNAGADELLFSVDWPETEVTIELAEVVPDMGGYAELELVSDKLIQPAALDPSASDARKLGFGLIDARGV